MGITRKQAIKLHRKLWSWLSENPEADEDDWPEWDRNTGDIEECKGDSPCCEYTKKRYLKCQVCPIDWGNLGCNDKYERYDLKGLYVKWNSTIVLKTKSKLAKRIANLPERDIT